MPKVLLPHTFADEDAVLREWVEDNFRALSEVVNHLDGANFGAGAIPLTALATDSGNVILPVNCNTEGIAFGQATGEQGQYVDAFELWDTFGGYVVGGDWELISIVYRVGFISAANGELVIRVKRDGAGVAGTQITFAKADDLDVQVVSGLTETFTEGQRINVGGTHNGNVGSTISNISAWLVFKGQMG